MLKVFYTEVSEFPSQAEGLALSEYRLNRLEKIKSPEKRKQGIGAELLLNHAVKTVFPESSAPYEIGAGEYGKPYFEKLPLFFSLSHSGDFSACAVSDCPVGLDIETKAEYREALAKRFFNPEEIQLLEKSENKDFDFARIWTAKESALKYTGSGLKSSLRSVSIVENDRILILPENTRLRLAYKYTEDFWVTVCTSQEQEEIAFCKIELNLT